MSTRTSESLLGATVRESGVEFRIWAPLAETLELVIRGRDDALPMTLGDGGYWTAEVAGAGAGTRYAYRRNGEGPFPDPCSRSQPDGVHEFSEVIDLSGFSWSGSEWSPPPASEAVIYELHTGTFTPEGTFGAAAERLEYLASLGVNVIELMPVAAFPGRWNWGYDGVAHFAPFAGYGSPEDLCRFVDAAHAHGLAVILDVVFNHSGPDGDYTGVYGPYRTARHSTPWGDAVNFDDDGSEAVREFYRQAVLMWLNDYHVDGFRLDATHEIRDSSPRNILAELADTARSEGRPGIVPLLFAETHENDSRYVHPETAGGLGFDGVWADDFHHSARTTLFDEREGYFRSYDGSLESLGRCISQGFLFEGQVDKSLGEPRGHAARDVPWHTFVYCLQNHDQVGNRAFGERLNALAANTEVRAMSTLLLLLPQVPLIFQGQEFCSSSPFLYFTDHSEPLGTLVTEGRRREFGAFELFRDEAMQKIVPSPQDPRTFDRSKLDWSETEIGAGRLNLDLYRELLRIRRENPVLVHSRQERGALETAVDGDALTISIANDAGRAVIVVNLGKSRTIEVPGANGLQVVLSSEEARYGGSNRPAELDGGKLSMAGRCAVVLSS